MPKHVVLVPLIVCALQTASAQEPQSGTFRSRVDLVAVTVTVQNTDGSFARELVRENFHVFENGVEQPIAVFGTGEVPVDLVLMLDTSASMTARLHEAQHAAGVLVNSLPPLDRAAVFSFGGRINQVTDVTADHRAVLQGIANLRAGGTTPLYDAVYIALKRLQVHGSATEPRRTALVVLTDGDDTASHISFESVQQLAREIGVAIYTVSLRSWSPSLDEDAKTADYQMRALARDTGARSFFPAATENLDKIYASIASELASQYWIGFLPQGRTPHAFVPVTVATDRRNAIVRARSGYVVGQ